MNARVSNRPVASEPTQADPALPDDTVLVRALREGRGEALAVAFDRWHHRVRVLARRLLSDAAASEDLVQDVFTVLPAAMKRFRGDVTLERYLLGITVKRAKRHRRAAARRQRALDRLDDCLGGGAPHAPRDPEGDAYRRELGQKLSAVLDRLPLVQRVAVVLCDVEEMTSGEASVIAGVSESTVRTRLFHARRRLRAWLAEEYDE